jgi:hypothetical protein
MSSPARPGRGRAAAPAAAPDTPASPAPSAAGVGAPAALSPGAASSADELERAVDEEESEGEDLLDDDIYRADYQSQPELDQYEADGLADEGEYYEELDPRERARAERAIEKRERAEARRAGRRGAALDSPIEDEPVRKRE